jgi:alpha-ketoglutarate-dependent taurine dioxygenase
MEYTQLPDCPEWFGAALTVDIKTLLADPEAVRPKLLNLLNERGVLVFRNQSISPSEEVAFYKLIGLYDENCTHLVDSTAAMFQIPEAPEAVVIGNADLDNHHGVSGTISQKGGNYHWHYDSDSFRTLPATTSQMYCAEAPDHKLHAEETLEMSNGKQMKFPAGATAFVSTTQSYELLDSDTCIYIDHCVVHYQPRYTLREMPLNQGVGGDGVRPKVYFPPWNTDLADDAAAMADDDDAAAADSSYLGDTKKYAVHSDEELVSPHHPQYAVSHPLVWTHPATGKNAVMVHAVCMDHIEHPVDGHLSWERSMELVEKVVVPGAQPEFCYFHAWQPGDLVSALFIMFCVLTSIFSTRFGVQQRA